MRESNFSFPVQNRAAVVISSQLYDRRALDSTSPLPLFNSLTHLTYLTSTSPRIRDILTVDGGLERLVRLLREFCAQPPPPQSPRAIYGLKPAVNRKGKDKGKAPLTSDKDWLSGRESTAASSSSASSTELPSALPAAVEEALTSATSALSSFDRSAAFRFSLAFQCVVNIGVRGSETVRARVVQAGMLDVVSSVLESWLVSKGFAVCPSPTGSGAPRESKEVRVARRMELLERRQRDLSSVQASELARALRALPTSMHPSTRASLERAAGQIVSIPVRTALPPPIGTRPTPRRPPTAAEAALWAGAWGRMRDPTSSGSVSAVEEDPEQQDESMETEEDDATGLRRRDTIRGPSDPNVPLVSSRTTPLSEQSTGDSSSQPSASSSTTTLPVPVPGRPNRDMSHSNSSGNISDSVSAETSANATPAGGNTPTGSITIEAAQRERSGTVVARPVWDTQQPTASPSRRPRRASAATRRHRHNDVGTGTDDDITSEAEVDREEGRRGQGGRSVEGHAARMAVIVQPDGQDGTGMEMNMIVDQGPLQGVGIGVEQGLVNLDMQANDDLAMGAPPGAPGAVQNVVLPQTTPIATQQQVPVGPGATPRQLNDLTPRATIAPLVTATPTITTGRIQVGDRAIGAQGNQLTPTAATPAQAITAVQLALNGLSAVGASSSGATALGSSEDQTTGPYREEDVLLSLQLLAYLSKYPHVRQAFYKARIPLGPPLVTPLPARPPSAIAVLRANLSAAASNIMSSKSSIVAISPPESIASTDTITPAANAVQHAPNVFSLVERFTFRPSPSELHLPRLPQEIQYWAGVIMRNACRKDETRGGIRQCANMVCGKWESFPREFAKCRRCRKAKYCGKECQSKAWADGHRFWCSSRDAEAADATVAATADADPSTNGPNVAAAFEHYPPEIRAEARQIVAAAAANRQPPIGTPPPGGVPRRPGAQHPPRPRPQPDPTNTMIVRLTNAPRGTPPRANLQSPLDALARRAHAEAQNTTNAATAVPRPRIIQHAVPPPQAGPSAAPTAATTQNMEVDNRSPPPFEVRKRAGTLPGSTSPSSARSPHRSSPQPSTISADAAARQETLREMVRDIAAERTRVGLTPLRGLGNVEQDVSRLINNTTMSPSERSADLRRILRDFENVLDQDRLMSSPSVDEDGDAHMRG